MKLLDFMKKNPQFLIEDFGEGILTGDRQLLFAFYDSAKWFINLKNIL